MNMNTSMRKIFLKLCYFSLMILWISCDSKPASKADNTKTTPKETSVEQKNVESQKNIVFFGDSLTAGYGLDDTNDATTVNRAGQQCCPARFCSSHCPSLMLQGPTVLYADT